MKKYFKIIKENCLKKIDATGLSVFRMFFVVILFFEILQQYKFNEILYNDNPFIYVMDFSMSHLFFCWMFVLFFLFIGLFTRFAAILNYVFAILVFSQQHRFEYHIFGIYVSMSFLLLFMPISRVLSMDSLIEKLKYSTIGKFYKQNNKVYAVNYFAPVLLGIGLVYFDSMLFKMESPMWVKGLGMWLPANLPQATWNNMTFLMNNEFLVKFMGYLVMVFEVVFVFFMWFKRFRVSLFLIGTFFHLGILICFPIPWFALATIAIYLLMLPAGIWRKIRFKSKKPTFTFYYDYECPLCIKTVVLINHFDIFGMVDCKSVQGYYSSDPLIQSIPEEKMLLEIYSIDRKRNIIYSGYDTYVKLLLKMRYTFILGYIMKIPGISHIGKRIYSKVALGRGVYRCTHETCYMPVLNEPIKDDEPYLIAWLSKGLIVRKFWKYLLLIVLIVQFSNSFFATYPVNMRKKIPFYSDSVELTLSKLAKPLRTLGVFFIGIKNHPLFLDSHFDNYTHILRITYTEKNTEITLPIINDKGMPGAYINGPFWTNYTFRVNNPKFNESMYNNGIKRYLLYWLFKNGKSITENYTFKVYVKNIEIPNDWEKDFLNKQIAKPWKNCGFINLSSGIVSSSIDIL